MAVRGNFISAGGIAGTSGVTLKSGCPGNAGACEARSPVCTTAVTQAAMTSVGTQRATVTSCVEKTKRPACYLIDSGFGHVSRDDRAGGQAQRPVGDGERRAGHLR